MQKIYFFRLQRLGPQILNVDNCKLNNKRPTNCISFVLVVFQPKANAHSTRNIAVYTISKGCSDFLLFIKKCYRVKQRPVRTMIIAKDPNSLLQFFVTIKWRSVD